MSWNWAHLDDAELLSVAKQTDEHLAHNGNIATVIENTFWVFQRLLDLPPMTDENVFSGNLAPIIEAQSELQSSITLARLGMYKPALISLRSVLELGVLQVYWDIDDQSHLTIRKWWGGSENTPQSRKVRRALRQIRGASAYLESDEKFFDRASDLEFFLGGYVHTRGGRSSSRGLVPMTNTVAFSVDALSLWQQKLEEVGRVVLAVHLMKYPVGLQTTPLNEKFGLNPPAGGLVEPFVRDRFREYLDPDVRDRLQQISDNDEDALASAAWVNGLPDLTDEEQRKQEEQHDRFMIMASSYENWEETHDALARGLGIEYTAEDLAQRAEYRARLRAWAEEEGLLTLEDRRRGHASATTLAASDDETEAPSGTDTPPVDRPAGHLKESSGPGSS